MAQESYKSMPWVGLDTIANLYQSRFNQKSRSPGFSPWNLQVPHLRVQPTANQREKKVFVIPESFKNQNLNSLHTDTCLHSVLSARSLQPCPTLCDSMDCSPPGSSVHGILQARILEWVAMPSSRGSSKPRDQTRTRDGTCVFYVSCIGRQVLYHLGSPFI